MNLIAGCSFYEPQNSAIYLSGSGIFMIHMYRNAKEHHVGSYAARYNCSSDYLYLTDATKFGPGFMIGMNYTYYEPACGIFGMNTPVSNSYATTFGS